MTTTLLLDSDIIAFKFSAAAQTDFDWSGTRNIVSVTDDLADVTTRVSAYIDDLMVRLRAEDAIVCLSCPASENFRYKVLPSYKHNRVGAVKPLHLVAVKRWMADNYKTYERPTLEADDVMGILATHPNIVKGKKIIVSEDKDLQQIPGMLFNPVTRKLTNVSKERGDRYHMLQALAGDPGDGYSGCPGIGMTKAAHYLDNNLKAVPVEKVIARGAHKGQSYVYFIEAQSESPWDTVVSLYQKAGLTESDALIQARVSRICRASDYDFKTKQVKLWQPS